jgi:hypothetical protein
VEVLRKVHGEGGYVCHTSIAGDRQKNARQCVGAVMHATKTFKAYRQPLLAELQQKLRGQEKKHPILDYQEFLDHHKESFVEILERKTSAKLTDAREARKR